MRAAPLTTIKGGINRLRVKGGARADNLYDLLNGYETDAGTVKVRPGTQRVATLDSLTRGIVAFGSGLHTFCHVQVAVPDGFTLNIIAHPDSIAGYEIALERIHFAVPFLGALYVVAEFEDGAVYHYWLQDAPVWEANTEYQIGDLVRSSSSSALAYRATRLGDPYPTWAPNVPRSDGDGSGDPQSIVEPTVYNGFYYVCVATAGDNPQSGATEPVWPTETGAQVTEDTSDPTPSPGTTSDPSSDVPNADIRDRYGWIYPGSGL